MSIEIDSGIIVDKVNTDTFAEKAGIQVGDTIHAMNGQAIISIADMQWVLHNLPRTSALQIEIERDAQMMTKTLFLSDDWKKSDISWRGSMWGLRPKFKSWTPELSAEKKKQLGLKTDALTLRVHGVYSERLKEAGLKKGDIIIEADGMKERMTGPQFNLWIKLNYHEKDKLPIQVIREGQTISLTIPLE